MRSGLLRIARTLLAAALVLVAGFAIGSYIARVIRYADVGVPSQQAESSLRQDPIYHTWDQDADSNYYRVIGTAVVENVPDEGTVIYGELDELGRATGSVACITYESMTAGTQRERNDTSAIFPSGWGHNGEVDIAMPDGTIYHGFLFNRSHLVAKSMGGDDELHNLITGTRTQNVGANIEGSEGGMAHCEGLARMWLSRNRSGWVYYAATPVYEEQELVARSVIVDMRSSDGDIDQRIEVFNAARGYQIDYATGTFQQVEDANDAAEQIREQLGQAALETLDIDEGTSTRAVPVGSSSSEDGERKVIVTGSGKAYHHDETCSGLVNARSMEWVTVSEAEAMGRHPCGICGG